MNMESLSNTIASSWTHPDGGKAIFSKILVFSKVPTSLEMGDARTDARSAAITAIVLRRNSMTIRRSKR